MHEGFVPVSPEKIRQIDEQIKALEQQKNELLKEQSDKIVQELKDRAKVYQKHLSALLELVPRHSRNHCTDENNCNWHDNRCVRCVLIQAKTDRLLSPNNFWDFTNAINISLEKVYLE